MVSCDFVKYEDAIDFALSEIGDIKSEPTDGLYDGMKTKLQKHPEQEKQQWGEWVPGKGFSAIPKSAPTRKIVRTPKTINNFIA